MKAFMLGGGGKWRSIGSVSDLEIPGSRSAAAGGKLFAGDGGGFPAFLPKEVRHIKDPFARSLARRIQRLPVPFGSSESCIMSSCVKPVVRSEKGPVVLLHCFDRYTYPLLEDAGLEAWAIDVLGWGFSDLERRPPCDAASKRHHLYQLWKSYIKRPMILVGPSLGAAVAIDFAVHYPEAVHKLVLINASVYGKGTERMRKLPRMAAYGGVFLLKSTPLRTYAMFQCFEGLSLPTTMDWTKVARLHCLLPWWEDSTVSFMLSGGYNVVDQIKKVKKRTLVIMGMRDKLISNELAMRLCRELPNAVSHQIPNGGHVPHLEEPLVVAKLIAGFARDDCPSEEGSSLCELSI